MAPSRSAAIFVLFWCALLLPWVAAQGDTSWSWILADSVNSTAACPGRCLAVNDSSDGEYENKPAVFVACKGTASASDSSSSSDSNNNNQQWLRGVEEGEGTIQFNATAATEGQSRAILCLQPDPATSNQTLKVAACTAGANQQWIVANNSIATMAFDPPRYLAMSYRLAGFLNTSDGPIGWRKAIISPSARPRNSSYTTTFSVVGDTQDLQPPLATPGNDPQNFNFIRNGGFEQSSYDFPNGTAEFPMNSPDPFSLCSWQIIKSEATLRGGPDPGPAEGNRSLYLKDGIVKQNALTSTGAFYTLAFKVARATPPPPGPDDTSGGSGTIQCNNSDTLSVNPYPSTDVHLDVEVQNTTWTTMHVSFQALGKEVQLAFRGCAICGCHLDDVNLMQVLDSAPFPPPPLRPSPPGRPFPPGAENKEPPQDLPCGYTGCSHSNRLSNGAVAGMVVGAAALFFLIGAACVGVAGVNKKEPRKENEIGSERPREWSIQTTTPAQSQGGGRGSSSNVPTTPPSVPTPVSASTITASPPLSSSNPHSIP